jgi:hypothetical protein
MAIVAPPAFFMAEQQKQQRRNEKNENWQIQSKQTRSITRDSIPPLAVSFFLGGEYVK